MNDINRMLGVIEDNPRDRNKNDKINNNFTNYSFQTIAKNETQNNFLTTTEQLKNTNREKQRKTNIDYQYMNQYNIEKFDKTPNKVITDFSEVPENIKKKNLSFNNYKVISHKPNKTYFEQPIISDKTNNKYEINNRFNQFDSLPKNTGYIKHNFKEQYNPRYQPDKIYRDEYNKKFQAFELTPCNTAFPINNQAEVNFNMVTSKKNKNDDNSRYQQFSALPNNSMFPINNLKQNINPINRTKESNDDINVRFQNYSPLPKNINKSNSNQLNDKTLLPINTRQNYNF